MLEAALVQFAHAVKLGVIARHSIDVREIETGQTSRPEDRQVGVVRQQLIYFVSQRMRNGMRRGFGKLADQPPILLAGLEHYRWTTAAARLEIEYQPDVRGPRMLFHERARAEQT